MEQKTEASQAVDELLADFKKALQLADKVGRSRQDNGYAQNSTAVDALVTLQMSIKDRIRAALKAQPAPTIAAKPVKYEQRFVSPQGIAAVWHDAQAETFHRHRSNGDLGDGWVQEVRALYAGPPASTEAPKGPLEIPEPGNSNSLADRIFRLPCNWKGDRNLSAAIEMGHAMACEQAYDLAYKHAAQASTEAARDRIPMPTNADQAELMQKLGLAWLQTNAPDRLTDASLAAQGEDSALLIAMLVDRDTPTDNRRDVIDHDIRGNPITREMVARASAETGGVKP